MPRSPAGVAAAVGVLLARGLEPPPASARTRRAPDGSPVHASASPARPARVQPGAETRSHTSAANASGIPDEEQDRGAPRHDLAGGPSSRIVRERGRGHRAQGDGAATTAQASTGAGPRGRARCVHGRDPTAPARDAGRAAPPGPLIRAASTSRRSSSTRAGPISTGGAGGVGHSGMRQFGPPGRCPAGSAPGGRRRRRRATWRASPGVWAR